MGKSKNVHANNGDRSVFPTRCEIRRSKDESAYGRERPRLRLPRARLHAGRSRPRTDLDLIGTGDSISLVAASSLLVLLPPRHPESCSTAAARLTQVSVRRIQEQGCLRVYT